MRVVVQLVKSSKVETQGQIAGKIARGLNILVGFTHEDTEKDIDNMLSKILNLRIFTDEEDKMNLSALDVGAELLIVSQFTLYADTNAGRRPSFIKALAYDKAELLYEKMLQKAKLSGLSVQGGCYGASMLVTIENDGPVTIILDSEKKS